MEKKKRQQVFRDPIYGYIHVDYDFITNLIDTPVFQRLRRIRQLSGVNMVFHGAEHSRFSHSLGAYELANKFLNISVIKETLNERQSLLFLSAALLHDIGHGPYSHAFEHTFNVDHELIGAKLILENQDIRNILDNIDHEFAQDVAGIIKKCGKYPIIEQLISSQLDVDRLDYLERDAFFTGAAYGHVDLDRLLRVVEIKNNQVVYKESGIHAIENYLVSRYHMYWQVYFHPKAQAYEIILEKIYERIKDLIKENFIFTTDVSALKNILHNPNDLNAFLYIDDFYMNGLISTLINSQDSILRQLANDFLNRRIWQFVDATEENIKNVNQLCQDYQPIEKKYFIAYGHKLSKPAYSGNLVDEIMILTKNGDIVPLSAFSSIIHSLVTTNKLDQKIFYRPVCKS